MAAPTLFRTTDAGVFVLRCCSATRSVAARRHQASAAARRSAAVRVDSCPVQVEVDVLFGMSGFTTVGPPDTCAKAAKRAEVAGIHAT